MMTLPEKNGNLNRGTGMQTRSSRSIVCNSNIVKKRLPTNRKSSVKMSKKKTLTSVDNNNVSTNGSTSAKRPRIINNEDLSTESPPQLFIDESTTNCMDIMENGQIDLSHHSVQQNHCNDSIPNLGETRMVMQDSDSLSISHTVRSKSTDLPAITNSIQQQMPSFSPIDEYRIRRSLDEALKSTEIDIDTRCGTTTVSGLLRNETDDVLPMPSPISSRGGAHHHHHGERHRVKWNVSSTSQQAKSRIFVQPTRPNGTQPTSRTSTSIVRKTMPAAIPTGNSTPVNYDLSYRRNSIRPIPSVRTTNDDIHPMNQSSNATQIPGSSVIHDHSRQMKNTSSSITTASQVERNLALLQSLPEFRALQRQVKVLQKRIKQWSHDYSVLENKYKELQENSFPRPSADGYEFLCQLLESMNHSRPDDDARTEVDLASDLNMTHDKLISLQHENPQRTALNILHALFPTNKDKAALLGIRQMNAVHGDMLRTIYLFARRGAPGTGFSMRKLRHAFGMAIRQARYRLNLSNTTVVKLGSAVAAGKAGNNGNGPDASTPDFDTFIEDLEDVESYSTEDENIE